MQDISTPPAAKIPQPQNTVPVTVNKLILGMFISDIDRPWRETPFLIEGFLLDDLQQIDELHAYCHEVLIDLDRSREQAIRHLKTVVKNQPLEKRLLSEGLVKAEEKIARIYPEWQEPEPGANWLQLLGRFFSSFWARKLRPRWHRTPRLRPIAQRFPGLPPNIEPLTYEINRPIEKEIQHARQSHQQVEEVLENLVQNISDNKALSIEELTGAVDSLVESMVSNPEALMWVTRMRETNTRLYGHGVKVAIYLVALGRHLGFPPDYLHHLAMIGLLLDIGKTHLPNDLLDKPEKLSEAEFNLAQKHVEMGLKVLADSQGVDSIVQEGIAQHHERLNGIGYPKGLKGEEISIYGRMAAIADSFAALTSERPYAKPCTTLDAMKILFADSKTLFHEPLIEQFVQAIGIFPVGTLVELSNGEVGAVVSHNRTRRLQPRILLLADHEKNPYSAPVEIDLLMEPKDAKGRPISIVQGLPAGAYGINPSEFFLK